MNNKRVPFILTLFVAFFLNQLSAQESLNTSGNEVSSTSGSISNSVGQVFYQVTSSSDNAIHEGIMQPFEIIIESSTEIVKGINLEVAAYPNPTTNYLILKVEKIKLHDLKYQLFDLSGKILEEDEVLSSETLINMSNYITDTYILRVNKNQHLIQSFKIIKN
jgi:hypothetical protein